MNGHDEDRVARQLRESLQREALRITPRDRLGEIRAQAASPLRQVRPVRPTWYIPLAAAAAVAVLGGLVWSVGALGAGPSATPAAPSVAVPSVSASGTGTTTSTTPSTTRTTPSSTPTTSRSLPPSSTETRSLPVYYVAPEVPVSTPDVQLKLFRAFVPTQLRVGEDPAVVVQRALELSMDYVGDQDAPAVRYWEAVRVLRVVVERSLIRVELSSPGGPLEAADKARLAAHQLAWTAQAALGKGNVAVQFSSPLASRDSPLLGQLPWSTRFTRPPADRQYELLAAVWVDDPARDAVLPSSADVTVTGSACVFEGALRWTLDATLATGDRLPTRDGTITATSGCPVRGTYRFSLGQLSAGSYRISVLAIGETGLVRGIQSRSFTVQ